MKPLDLWKKMILGKVYTKEVVTNRVTVIYSVGQFSEEEYTELINLIEDVYMEEGIS